MAIDNKYFVGGLNTDDEDRVIPNGDYRYSLNIRNSKSDNDSQGTIENTKGNTLVNYSLGAGQFKTIGGYDDKINNKVYYFVWSSVLMHKILEFDANTNTVSLVLESGLLNFEQDKVIVEQNIAVIGGLMYWVNVKPYRINIKKAKTNGYPNPLQYKDISAIVPPPLKPPLTYFGSTDITTELNPVKTNNVRGKLFQFRYKYVYDDNEESAWSPISKIALPINEGQYRPYQYYDTTLNNFINIDIELGGQAVKRVKVAFREKNSGDFYLAKDIDKSTISTSIYSFRFYNNETYISLDNDGNKGMRLFDWIPQESNTQSLIDGNRIAYGGITENYDPTPLDITVTPVYNDLPKTAPPDTANLITNQIAGYAMYGQPIGFVDWGNTVNEVGGSNNQSNRANSVAGSTVFAKWDKNIPTSITGAGNAGIVNLSYLPKPDRGGFSGTGFWVTNQHSLEVLIKNDNISNGTIAVGARVVVSVTGGWYDFESRAYKSKTFTFQETAVQGDTASIIGDRFKNQIHGYTYSERGVEINLISQNGQYARAYNGIVNTNQNYGTVLDVQFFAYTPSADVLSVSGYTPYIPQGERMPCLYTASIDAVAYAGWTTKSEKTLKMGSKHGVGIIYSDGFNRSSLVNISDDSSFYVKYPTERSLPSGRITDVVELDVEIRHFAPKWATQYQFVYTGNQTVESVPLEGGFKGFIQTRLSGLIVSPTITGNSAMEASLDLLNATTSSYKSSIPESIDIAYGFSKGDRIRFLKDVNDNYYQKYEDVEIIKYDQSTNKITFKKPSISISGNIIVEIYSPKKSLENPFYYEIGEVFPIIDGGNGYYLHGGDTNQSIVISGTTALFYPAKVRLRDIGDVYLRYRESPITTQVEDYNYSDYYDSDSWDKGRANIVDNNITRTYRPTTIRYTEAFIPETNINGLSQVNDFSFESYEHKYGDIKLLYSEDKLLNVFQQLKVGAIGISQDVIYGDAGEVVSTSRNENRVLSKSIRYYAGEFGIGNNPESFAVYGNSKYFTDTKRGAVLRLGGDGITPISNYKMSNYFNDIFMLLDSQNVPYNIYGVYDSRFDEYILHLTNGITKETIAFSEGKNRWTTFYSYEPDFMVSNRVGLITFKDGSLFTHNTNTFYNSFYGVQGKCGVRFISNVEPNKIKLFNNLTVDATDVFEMPQAINQFGQKTSLIVDDFEDVEGVYKAALLRDENTPNVSLPLIEGDEIRCHSLDITLENTSTDLVKLFSVGVGVTLSELTNR